SKPRVLLRQVYQAKRKTTDLAADCAEVNKSQLTDAFLAVLDKCQEYGSKYTMWTEAEEDGELFKLDWTKDQGGCDGVPKANTTYRMGWNCESRPYRSFRVMWIGEAPSDLTYSMMQWYVGDNCTDPHRKNNFPVATNHCFNALFANMSVSMTCDSGSLVTQFFPDSTTCEGQGSTWADLGNATQTRLMASYDSMRSAPGIALGEWDGSNSDNCVLGSTGNSLRACGAA
ncbi:unnamed protein product, partial [Symbiodinium pilosum]